jgi:hypothetical protein
LPARATPRFKNSRPRHRRRADRFGTRAFSPPPSVSSPSARFSAESPAALIFCFLYDDLLWRIEWIGTILSLRLHFGGDTKCLARKKTGWRHW